MKLPFLIGLVIAIAANLIGFLLKDYNLTLKITGVVVISSFVICGTFLSGIIDIVNLRSETQEERDKKMKIIKYLLFLSIPNMIVSLVILLSRY